MCSLLCVWHSPGEPVANRMPHNSSENKIQRKQSPCLLCDFAGIFPTQAAPDPSVVLEWNIISDKQNKNSFCTGMSHVFNESVWVWGHYRNNTSHTKFKAELCAVIIAN